MSPRKMCNCHGHSSPSSAPYPNHHTHPHAPTEYLETCLRSGVVMVRPALLLPQNVAVGDLVQALDGQHWYNARSSRRRAAARALLLSFATQASPSATTPSSRPACRGCASARRPRTSSSSATRRSGAAAPKASTPTARSRWSASSRGHRGYHSRCAGRAGAPRLRVGLGRGEVGHPRRGDGGGVRGGGARGRTVAGEDAGGAVHGAAHCR